MNDHITARQFHATPGVEEWRVIGDGACSFFRTESFEAATRLVEAIGRLPGIEEHQPDIDIRPDGITVRLLTSGDDYYGMSTADVNLAQQISATARDLGMVGNPSRVQSMLIVPGVRNVAEVMPFWRAVLGYEPRADSPEEDLVDPHNRGPGVWFEEMSEMRSDGGGAIHVAVWVPIEEAESRVAAALAAGGHMVRDHYAPAWWTLADAAGNEADIATTAGRD